MATLSFMARAARSVKTGHDRARELDRRAMSCRPLRWGLLALALSAALAAAAPDRPMKSPDAHAPVVAPAAPTSPVLPL